MFADEMRKAVLACERRRLPELSAAIWKGYAAGAISADDAQALAEAVEARKAVPVMVAAPRRVGSRPRSPESLERRRRWVASGWLPPNLACQFTAAEVAVLGVIAQEHGKGRVCRLTIGHIAALAGCGKTTVRSAVRHAQDLGLLRSEEWRLTAFRSAPNSITILSPEWLGWLRLRVRQGGGSKSAERTNTHLHSSPRFAAMKGLGEGETARSGPSGSDILRIVTRTHRQCR